PVELDDKVRKALLTNGDFLISRSNTPDKVGRSIRFKGEIENCSYPDLMMKFRVDPEKADPNFLEFKLSSSEIRQYYKSCAAGSSRTMVKINKS
ncbi:restriction endonuclease subunit S, partial [Escherichia coli]|nr:restriction endonuclease subunit S [Escherichia coli]